jgi:hypothetical protein
MVLQILMDVYDQPSQTLSYDRKIMPSRAIQDSRGLITEQGSFGTSAVVKRKDTKYRGVLAESSSRNHALILITDIDFMF